MDVNIDSSVLRKDNASSLYKVTQNALIGGLKCASCAEMALTAFGMRVLEKTGADSTSGSASAAEEACESMLVMSIRALAR
jgi:hypothetical protein